AIQSSDLHAVVVLDRHRRGRRRRRRRDLRAHPAGIRSTVEHAGQHRVREVMRLLGLLAGVAAASSACGSTSHAGYVLVTVDARPAVHDAASITVTLANAGTMRTDTLMLGGKAFPVTFSVSAPGRTGDLAITIDALDASGLVIGHG